MHFPGVSLVTGAASGIGRATAKLFAQEGCERIVIADRDVAGLAKVKTWIESEHNSVEIFAIATDVASEDSVRKMIQGAIKRFGRIDYACNVAGILIPGVSTDFTLADWEKQFAVNTRGMWLCQREQLAQIIKQDAITPNDSRFESRGAIANVASMAGLRAGENLAPYCATKHAVVGFTKADALYYARYKIRINAVCPGVTKAPILGEIPDSHDNNVEEMTREMAVKRMGLPEEVAECLVWIASGRAALSQQPPCAPVEGFHRLQEKRIRVT